VNMLNIHRPPILHCPMRGRIVARFCLTKYKRPADSFVNSQELWPPQFTLP